MSAEVDSPEVATLLKSIVDCSTSESKGFCELIASADELASLHLCQVQNSILLLKVVIVKRGAFLGSDARIGSPRPAAQL